ncbi:MAG: AI-2E family transporter [Anaerolineae bacterium]|nr:AI-2E family transporter [Anaerolineae bacterium]
MGGLGSLAGSILSNLALILFITLYMVLDPHAYYRGIIALVPRSREGRALEIINEVRRTVLAWMNALLISISAMGSMVTVAMLVIGVPNALALGLIAGLSSFVPYIGYYIALLPIAIFAAAGEPWQFVAAVVCYVLAGEIESKIITPNVVQNELSLPAGLIMLFQLIAATYLGFFGIVLAVPLLAILVALVREVYVHDTLKKRDRVPHIREDEQGTLHLVYPEGTEGATSPTATPNACVTT